MEGLSKDLSKDFGRTEFHHERMDAFAAVTEQWLAAGNARGHTAIVTWAQRRPSLAAYRSPTDLVATINTPGHPERSCSLLSDLLVVAQDDPLAQLAVLRALIPGLRRAAHRRWKMTEAGGPWMTEAELTADAVSVAWEAIRHHAGEHHVRPARLIVRRVERRLRTTFDMHRRDAAKTVSLRDIDPATYWEPLDDDHRVASALREAMRSGQLDHGTARLAYQVAILGDQAMAAGRRAGLPPDRTRHLLRLTLEVLAGETRPSHAGQISRPSLHAQPQEDHAMRPSHHEPNPVEEVERSAIVPLLLTVKQAAEMLGIGRSTLYELLDAGELRSVKRGASRRIPLKEVHDYIDRLLNSQGDHNGAVTSAS